MTSDDGSEATGTRGLGPSDTSKPKFVSDQFLGRQLPRSRPPTSPRMLATEAIMLVVMVCEVIARDNVMHQQTPWTEPRTESLRGFNTRTP